MPMMLTITDEEVGGKQKTDFEMEIPSAQGVVTARELIELRVRQEVARFNAGREGAFHGLVQPTDTEWIVNGYALRTWRPINADQQVEMALQAFETNGFFILAGSRQVENLDDEIDLAQTSEISFIKLVPLIGG